MAQARADSRHGSGQPGPWQARGSAIAADSGVVGRDAASTAVGMDTEAARLAGLWAGWCYGRGWRGRIAVYGGLQTKKSL